MDAVIYTRDGEEFETLGQILREEAGLINVYRDPLDGHRHLDHAYDIVVVALEGAEGMEVVMEHRDRHPDSQIIWITSDRYFAGVAIRKHVFDFILRPLEEERFRQSVRDGIPRCLNRTCWTYRP